MYNWYDELHGIMVVYMPLPQGVDGFLSPCPDGTYEIIISTDICEERQRKAYEHELDHIRHDDLYRASAEEAELRCHYGIQKTA